MKKLIEVHAFANCPVFSCGGNPNDPYYAGYCDALDRVVEWMENFPAVDAVPVVHGRWIDEYPYVRCSVCNAEWLNCRTDNEPKLFYCCPNCGARMDLEVE